MKCKKCGHNMTAEAYKQHKHNPALCLTTLESAARAVVDDAEDSVPCEGEKGDMFRDVNVILLDALAAALPKKGNE